MSLFLRKCIHTTLLVQARRLQMLTKISGSCEKFCLFQHADNICILPCSPKNRPTLHTCGIMYLKGKSQHKHEKRKETQKIKAAHIKSGMTVSQLCFRLRVTKDECLACLELITNKECSLDEEIHDISVLKQVCDMLDRQYIVVKDKKKTVAPKSAKDTAIDVDIKKRPPASIEALVHRPPVVTIMGHVDHGKTTLLDALRESSIVDKEFGGITQHVGAFVVRLKSGHSITFLDTPGHQAFSAMRARGASVTDIVILVIAAEDGIMPQTIESIQHAQSSKVPLIIAINKIDKHKDSVDVIKNHLASHDVIVEDYGGDVQVVPISALKRINLDKLEESVITLAEFLELKADPDGLVEANIIETKTSVGHGKMATLLVRRGTLKKGAYLISGTTWTKVKAMFDSNGQQVMEALPSTPVAVGGWKELPIIGDEVLQAESQKQVSKAVEYRLEQIQLAKDKTEKSIIDEKRRAERDEYVSKRAEKFEILKHRSFRSASRASLRTVEHIKYKGFLPENEVMEASRPRFHVIIKGDVAGSVEAIVDTLATFRSDLCDLDIVHSGVGDVTTYDIELANLCEGEVYAFNVDVEVNAKSQTDNVPIKHHNVIYHLFNDLIDSINHQLPPTQEEEIIGTADVLKKFDVTVKSGGKKHNVPVAGCSCVSGNLEKKHLFKVVRGDEVVIKGQHLASLRHHKNEVSSIVSKQECGLQFHMDDSQTFEVGDTVICFKYVKKKTVLDWKPEFTYT